MRVALITKGFGYNVNDWCLPALIDLVRTLAQSIEVDVYATEYPNSRRTYSLHGARVFSFGTRPGRMTRGIGRQRVLRALADEHAAKPYDILHAVWADEPANIGRIAAARANLPLVSTFFAGEAAWVEAIQYGSRTSTQPGSTLRRAVAASAAVTCGSHFLADQLRDRLGLDPVVIPLGIDLEHFAPDGPRTELAGQLRLLTAASTNRVKGLDVIVAALRQLTQEHPALCAGLHWHMIGPDGAAPAVRAAFAQSLPGLPVTLHHGVPFWEMPKLYRAADLFVLGSHFESQCVAIQEAAACGIPSAGTRVGVLPEMATEDWCVPPGDSRAMVDLLRRLLQARATWGVQAQRQRAWVAEHASIAQSADDFLALYRHHARTAAR